MSLRRHFTDYSRGDHLGAFWRLFFWRARTKSPRLRDVQSFFLSRMAHRHGGYIGRDCRIGGKPLLPHGLHGVYISRFAALGRDCCIYQNVTIGEVRRRAPTIGEGCLIGAGAVLVGDIVIGSHVKIGAGAVVCRDVAPGCTVVAPGARTIERGDSREQSAGESLD